MFDVLLDRNEWGTTIRYDVVAREHTGMRRIELSLHRPVSYRHEEQLGHSTLVVGPGHPRRVDVR